MARQMARWVSRGRARGPAPRRGDVRALIAVVMLAGLLGVYAYKRWVAEPLAPHVGTAWVADGDTLEISGVRIRLGGIDAPELDQSCTDDKGQTWSCGRAATQELRTLIRGRDLKCEHKGKDQFQRVLAVCFLSDGSDVNAWMVRQGWALAFSYGGTYQSEQDEARAAKRGIWAGTFMPPREWRQQHVDHERR
jgi:endonuclease YncB( thermonuclease family)